MIKGRLKKLVGRFLKIGGRFRKCLECCETTECLQAVYAQACFLSPDENCELEETLGFWVCADDACADAPSTPFRDAAATIYLEGKCFRTGTEIVDIADLPEGTFVAVNGSAWACRATCEHEDCGTKPSVCNCACHVYYGESDPPGAHDYCCYGKFDADGNIPNFNWTKSHTILQTSQSTKFTPIVLASCAERDCDNEASCVILEYASWSAEAASANYGCCLDKVVRSQTTVSRTAGCCDNPNSANDTIFETAETWCGNSVPRVNTTVIENYLVPGAGPGCTDGSYIVTTENGDCDSYTISVTDDFYSSGSYDGVNCSCQIHQHYESVLTYTFTGGSTAADQAICNQCHDEYAE